MCRSWLDDYLETDYQIKLIQYKERHLVPRPYKLPSKPPVQFIRKDRAMSMIPGTMYDQVRADILASEAWVKKYWWVGYIVCFFAGWTVAGYLYHH